MKNNKFVRTVLGDIDPQTMGIVDCHDHLIKNGGPEMQEHIDFLMIDTLAASEELQSFLDAGGKTMVTMDPPNVGRDVPRMLEIAKKFAGKAHLIMTTGFHKAKFYDKYSSWLKTVEEDKIVAMMVAEIEEGMDVHSYNGPVIERVPHQAGIIKCGTSYGVIDPLELKELRIAAKTYHQTGVPILIHTQLGTMGYEVASILLSQGVDPHNIILSHLNKNPDKYYYEKILQLGVFIAFDGPDRVKYYPDSLLAENIKWLCDRGYQHQILLAMDAGRFYYQTAYSATKGTVSNGIAYLLTNFVPLLKQVGITQAMIDDMLINNPQVALSFDVTKRK
ncbi:phosphotriesterase [Spiroplasma sp. DGKH1]|uniref:phosphotriesterase n=1 Tax=Spiroplasma sp. DGKH1 TaxID=3050074 RepID=UPI0034C60491